jgi:hypothetical protein
VRQKLQTKKGVCLQKQHRKALHIHSTKWALKVFEEWQSTRSNKIALKECVDFEGVVLASVQNLSVPIDEMTTYSLNLWLCMFVTEVAKQNNGERYPQKSLYLVVSVCGINCHLLELKKDNGVSILVKGDRRLVAWDSNHF